MENRADPVSATMDMIAAIVSGDQFGVIKSIDSFGPLSVEDTLTGLSYLAELMSSVANSEDRQIMREELAAAEGPAEVVSAVGDIGSLIFVAADPAAAHAAIVAHAGWLEGSVDDLWAAVAGELLFAVARIVQRTGFDIPAFHKGSNPR